MLTLAEIGSMGSRRRQRRRAPHHPYGGPPNRGTDGLPLRSGRRPPGGPPNRTSAQRATADGDQLIGLVTLGKPAGRVYLMPTSDRDSADAHAADALLAIEQGKRAAELSPTDLASFATAEALLAIFHQLKHMDDQSITRKGAAELTDAIDMLSRKLPDH